MKFKSQAYPKQLARTGPEAIGLQVERAEGAYIWDVFGKRYIDLIAGVAIMNLGHNHPRIKTAIKNQLDKHSHVMVYGEFIQESSTLLAEKLNEVLPDKLNTSYFVNSGTEANEGALKLARRYTRRSKIISCKGAYHGSTLGSLSVSGNENKKASFRPLIPDVEFIRHNSISDLSMIDNKTAAVIIEVIQGDAGVRIANHEYMNALAERCRELGALLIIDEIQTGIGRTGKLFSFMHYDIVPDILTCGKALGGGLPIGAFISDSKIMEALTSDPPLGHITSFGGNPICCASALEVLRIIEDEKILDNVEEKGKLLEVELQHKKIQEVRRMGLMLAVELSSEEEVLHVIQRGLDEGIILFWFLSHPKAFRIAPPLNIGDKDLAIAGQKIREILDELN